MRPGMFGRYNGNQAIFRDGSTRKRAPPSLPLMVSSGAPKRPWSDALVPPQRRRCVVARESWQSFDWIEQNVRYSAIERTVRRKHVSRRKASNAKETGDGE